MLVKFAQSKKEDWDLFLDTSVFAYNTSRHDSTIYTPFELMFGRRCYLPIDVNTRNCNLEDFLKEYQKEDRVKNIDRLTKIRSVTLEKAKINIKKAQEKQKYHYDLKHATSNVYKIGAKVLLKDLLRKKRKGGKLDTKWLGPFVIRKNLGKGLYYICDDRNMKSCWKRVHGTHLKLYHSMASDSKERESFQVDPPDRSLSGVIIS